MEDWNQTPPGGEEQTHGLEAKPPLVERPEPLTQPWPAAGALAFGQEPQQPSDGWQQTRREPPAPPSPPPTPAMPEQRYGQPQTTPERTLAPDPTPAAAFTTTLPAPDPMVAVVAQAEKVPLLKREITFRRKRTERAVRPPAEKVPLLKREIRFRKGGGSDVQQPEAKASKPPLLKRELNLGRKRGASHPTLASADRSRGKKSNTKKLVGLTIGSSQLAAAEVVNNGHAEVVKLASRALDRGIVVGGELREPAALTAALKSFFRENRLPQRDVRLGIASNRIGMRIIEVEGIEDGKQLDNVVRFRAQEALPIPIDQAVLDYHVLSEHDMDGVHVRRILLVVAYREPIARYVEACREAGLKLVGVDLEAFGLLRALQAPDRAVGLQEAAEVVVALGHERSVLAISAHGVCEFTRVLDWGGFALDVGLARELDVTPTAAEPTRRALGARGTHIPGGLDPAKVAAARAAIQHQVQGFARELVSALQFYQDQPNSLAIREIVLAGGLTQMEGMDRELERLSGVPVRVGDPLEHVRHRKRVAERDDLPALAGAIGLGIEV